MLTVQLCTEGKHEVFTQKY